MTTLYRLDTVVSTVAQNALPQHKGVTNQSILGANSPVRFDYQVNELANVRKPKTSQPSGLALIESLYFRAGAHAAQQQLQRLLGPEQDVRPYALCDAGLPSIGMDIVPEDEIRYESFSPPASWNTAYSIQRVHLGPKEKNEFVFHPGEELLIPVRGAVGYHFYWSPGSSVPQRILLQPPVSAGKMIRINPQIPHHAWGAKEDAVAWLILRHSMNSPIALVMDGDAPPFAERSPRAGKTPLEVRDPKAAASLRAPVRRRVTAQDLQRPGAYAMIAWGISELIRDARQNSGLTTTDLARQVGIDPSSLSRLEEAKANVSIEMLARVCRALRIGIGERMASGGWIHESGEVDSRKMDLGDPVLFAPQGAHYLHPYLLHLHAGDRRSVETGRGKDPTQVSSWIVLRGKFLADLPQNLGGKSILVDTGNVIHFREKSKVSVHALQECEIVQIVHSQSCLCKPVGAPSRGAAGREKMETELSTSVPSRAAIAD